MKLKIIFPFILLVMVSCDKLLDVKPRNVGVQGTVFKNTAQIQLLLNSAYDALRSDRFMGGNVWLASELLADNLEAGQLNNHYLAIYNRSGSIFNDVSRQIWNHGYMVIYRCNLVLEALETAQGVRPEDLARLRGQALFLRAYSHFQLLRLYAQPWGYTTDNSQPGIPIRLKSGIEPIARSTVKEVYEQIISDLNIAVQELPASADAGQAGVWTAKALLAEVFFQRNEFFFALKYARDVTENAPFIFQNDLSRRFRPEGSPENVFELVNEDPKSVVEPSGAVLWDMYHSADVKPQVYVSADYFQLTGKYPGDFRRNLWVKSDSSGGQMHYYCTKLNASHVFRVPLIHLTSLKLIFAEAAAEQGDLTRAVLQLNDIRRRCGLSNSLHNQADLLIDEIRHQRRIEMLCEGNRLQDLRRTAVRDGKLYVLRKAPWNCNGLLLTIPDDEISANPLVVQNPSGGCN